MVHSQIFQTSAVDQILVNEALSNGNETIALNLFIVCIVLHNVQSNIKVL